MTFKYKINLEIEVEFEAPLLGADTTKGKRKHADRIAIESLREMVKLGTTSYLNLDRKIEEDNLNGTIKGEISMRSAKLANQEKLIWANRIECTHYECVKKGSFFSEPFSHWCIEGNFYFGESAAKIVLIFGHQEKGGWINFFQKAGIKPNEIIEIDWKVLITEKFPEYPIPAILKKDLDNIDF